MDYCKCIEDLGYKIFANFNEVTLDYTIKVEGHGKEYKRVMPYIVIEKTRQSLETRHPGINITSKTAFYAAIDLLLEDIYNEIKGEPNNE